MTSPFEKFLVLLIIGLSIPAHALLIGYFLNRRWYRRKKRAIFGWLDDRGLIDYEEQKPKKF